MEARDGRGRRNDWRRGNQKPARRGPAGALRPIAFRHLHDPMNRVKHYFQPGGRLFQRARVVGDHRTITRWECEREIRKRWRRESKSPLGGPAGAPRPIAFQFFEPPQGLMTPT